MHIIRWWWCSRVLQVIPPASLLLADRAMQNQPAVSPTVCAVCLKWFNLPISVCLGLWVSNRRLSVRASFWGRLLARWRCVCLNISFLKCDVKYDGLFLRMSLLLLVSNAKASCKYIFFLPRSVVLGDNCTQASAVNHHAIKSMFLFWCFPFLLPLDSLSCISKSSCLK